MKSHSFADFHCHPNLKSYGHSFAQNTSPLFKRSNPWHYQPPDVIDKITNSITGLSRFSQADFTTMSRGNVRVALISLYPFEKGFFISGSLNGPVAARIANLITSIGYKRIRHLQTHTDYFTDLMNEYNFLKKSQKQFEYKQKKYSWSFASNWNKIQDILKNENQIAVIPTIEGAHVFNTGLEKYGRKSLETEVLNNVTKVKQWDCPPFFITLAHNFNNELCGHARSLEQLGPLVNQFDNINNGFSKLGIKVLHSLLSTENGKRIYIDVKHMSLKSRKEYYNILSYDYNNKVPVFVSHGAVTGTGWLGNNNILYSKNIFSSSNINFFDEEIIYVAKTNGAFSLQFDSNRLAKRSALRTFPLGISERNALNISANIIWAQLRHIAEILDRNNLFAWGTTTIGSDFDGTINPLNGIWTAEYFSKLMEKLLVLSSNYLKNKNKLTVTENKKITAEELVELFAIRNALNKLQIFYK
jgi:microsomal dipeptidase-like Zn-dependent dipeptidase